MNRQLRIPLERRRTNERALTVVRGEDSGSQFAGGSLLLQRLSGGGGGAEDGKH